MPYDAEKQMLREIVWFLGPQVQCYFCDRVLFTRPPGMSFGHRRHRKIVAKLTIHHKNENREDNTEGNLVLAHTRCHKEFHRIQAEHLTKER